MKKKWFMPFPRGLVWNEKQKVLSNIRTLVAKSISYDDNRYANARLNVIKVNVIKDIFWNAKCLALVLTVLNVIFLVLVQG